MPLRDDLLDPIPGDNPSGENLYHDKLFDQIKEARTEDTDTLPAGDWGRAAKKADHVLVIKLAGDALAKRSKDLRLAGWLVESLFKREGFPVLVPSLKFLHAIQETFWETVYPEIEEDGNKDLRVVAIESAANRLGAALRSAPITRSGFSVIDYLDSREVGYEEDANSSYEKGEARQDAIKQGRLTAEEFDAGFVATTKQYYVGLSASLVEAEKLLGALDEYQVDKYGDDYPSLSKLRKSLEEVKAVVAGFLYEKRQIEPDPIVEPEPEPESKPEPVPEPEPLSEEGADVLDSPVVEQAPLRQRTGGSSASAAAALKTMSPYALVVRGAEGLFSAIPQSPAAYLVTSGLRMADVRLQPYGGSGIAVGPPTEVRQKLVRLANSSEWNELLRESVAMLGEEYARAWLDLHRYVWRAARESGYSELAQAIVTTLRGLLQDVPDVRNWTLDDDTPAANQETQRWLDAEVVLPLPEPPPAPEPEIIYVERPAEPVYSSVVVAPEKTVFEIASELQQQGRADEAITMMVREASRQDCGRDRFQRRVEVAQLCLASNRDDIAFPILAELNAEIERRDLALWESNELLVKPMTMLLQCLESRGGPAEEREALFTRLCRLDPQAAFSVRR